MVEWLNDVMRLPSVCFMRMSLAVLEIFWQIHDDMDVARLQ